MVDPFRKPRYTTGWQRTPRFNSVLWTKNKFVAQRRSPWKLVTTPGTSCSDFERSFSARCTQIPLNQTDIGRAVAMQATQTLDILKRSQLDRSPGTHLRSDGVQHSSPANVTIVLDITGGPGRFAILKLVPSRPEGGKRRQSLGYIRIVGGAERREWKRSRWPSFRSLGRSNFRSRSMGSVHIDLGWNPPQVQRRGGCL